MRNAIVVLDDVLTSNVCTQMIQMHNQLTLSNSPFIKTFRDTIVCKVDPSFHIMQVLEYSIRRWYENIKIDWCEIVKWPPGSFQPFHKDTASNRTVLTSITYLNDDYEGGETQFENDMSIKPKIGRTVFFDGCQYVHGVKNILKGNRYTVPIWYKSTYEKKRG